MRMRIHMHVCLYFNALVYEKSTYNNITHMDKKQLISSEMVKNIKIKSNMQNPQK